MEAALDRFRGTIAADPPHVLRREDQRPKALRAGPEGAGGGAQAPGRSPSTSWSCWTQTGPGGISACGAFAPKAPTSAPSATTSGEVLGCGGAMSSPAAHHGGEASRLEDAVTLEEVQSQGESLLLPTDRLFAESSRPTQLPSAGREKRVRNGNPITDRDPAGRHLPGLRPERRFSLPIPGTGRRSHRHQEFLWRVTLSMKEKVIALGFFDGVHLGHAALLRRTVEEAARRGCHAGGVHLRPAPQGGAHRHPLSPHQLPRGPQGPGPAALWHPGGADGPL